MAYDTTLLWDRLPMTIAFMSLTALVAGDRFGWPVGRRLLIPLVAAGILSALYWAWSEQQGQGDLRFYGVVQFSPLLLIPLMLLLVRQGAVAKGWLGAAVIAYGLAKAQSISMRNYCP